MIVQIWPVFQKFNASLQHRSITFLTVRGFSRDTTSLMASLSTCEENFPTGIMSTQCFWFCFCCYTCLMQPLISMNLSAISVKTSKMNTNNWYIFMKLKCVHLPTFHSYTSIILDCADKKIPNLIITINYNIEAMVDRVYIPLVLCADFQILAL